MVSMRNSERPQLVLIGEERECWRACLTPHAISGHDAADRQTGQPVHVWWFVGRSPAQRNSPPVDVASCCFSFFHNCWRRLGIGIKQFLLFAGGSHRAETLLCFLEIRSPLFQKHTLLCPMFVEHVLLPLVAEVMMTKVDVNNYKQYFEGL